MLRFTIAVFACKGYSKSLSDGAGTYSDGCRNNNNVVSCEIAREGRSRIAEDDVSTLHGGWRRVVGGSACCINGRGLDENVVGVVRF